MQHTVDKDLSVFYRELQLEDNLTASCSDPNNNQPVRHADKKTVTFN